MGNYANGSVGESYGMIYTTNKQIQISLSGRRLRLRPCVLRRVRWYRRRRLEFRQFLRAAFTLRVISVTESMERLLYGMGLLFVTGVQQIPAGSPYPDYDHITCGVFSGGNVYWCDNVTFSSYGSSSPDTRYITFWWVGLNGVADSWMHNDVAYSYGKHSALCTILMMLLRMV